MITRILKATMHCSTALDYNEAKVMKGVAVLAGVRNMDGAYQWQLYETLERYESNRAASERLRSRAFHMTVSPSSEDIVTEEEMTDYIDGLMDVLGYGNQPYVIYRHNDTDHQHYHVVSVRVDGEGRAIPNAFEGRRAMAYQKKFSDMLERRRKEYERRLRRQEEEKREAIRRSVEEAQEEKAAREKRKAAAQEKPSGKKAGRSGARKRKSQGRK